ncbi:helix-turn-helix domain-containing protein [Actinomadura nitritigenes]|uniref:PucR family transcriptional regulator n=1 Tax=Actinomadura nitritigenes TaxID=134602 RepID=UPI003D93D92E
MGPVVLSPGLAEVLRSRPPKLCEEVCAAVRAAVPAYASADRTSPSACRIVQEAIQAFFVRATGLSQPLDGLDGLLRLFGEQEGGAGRSLDTVQAAIVVAFRTSWRRLVEVCARHQVTGQDVAWLAEVHFAHRDRVITQVVKGYLRSDGRAVQERAALRRRLLRGLVDRPPAAPAALADLAVRSGWSLPAEATPVAVPPGTRWSRDAAHGDVLADPEGDAYRLLVPGPFDAARHAVFGTPVTGGPVVIGPTVPLGGLPDAMRWTREALALTLKGVIAEAPVVHVDDHLLDLWLCADPHLTDLLAERLLGGLEHLPEDKRTVLATTLRVWLETWSTVTDVGARLHLHPQTVRYRLQQVRRLIDDPLEDPEARFAVEAVLRARNRRPAPGGPRDPARPEQPGSGR